MSDQEGGRRTPKSAKLASMTQADHREHLGKIPRELILRVAALRPILRLNGSVQVRRERDRRRTYRLRYRDPDPADARTQKSIAIPPEAVTGVRGMQLGYQGG